MKKLEAAVTAYVHAGTLAAMAIGAKGMGVQLNSDYDWLFFHLGQDALISQADREFVAERLFDYALKYQYKPEILYRQHAYWFDMAPKNWEDVDATLRLRFALFQAAANALAPFVEKPAPAEPEARPETRTHGFDRGFGDEDGGGRALKIGEERLPMSSPVADIANDVEAVAKGVDALLGEGTFASMAPPPSLDEALRDAGATGVGVTLMHADGQSERVPVGDMHAPAAAPTEATQEAATELPAAEPAENVPHAIDPEGEHAKAGKGKRRK